jgi:hypothetical protein
MKRDADLVRQILLKIEASSPDDNLSELSVEGYSPEQVTYHLTLLQEAGLIAAVDISGYEGEAWIPTRLTWHGHEFLDAARDEKRWRKVKLAMSKTGGVVVSVAEQLLIDLVKNQASSFLT